MAGTDPKTDIAVLKVGAGSLNPIRDGAEKTIPLTLAEMPTETANNEQPENSSEDALQGITTENVTARTAQQLAISH